MNPISTNNGGNGQTKLIIIAVVVVVLVAILLLQTLITLFASIIGGNQAQKDAQQAKEIPFQSLYQEVASKYPNIPWTILAAVHYYSDEYDIHLQALNSGSAATLKGKDPEIIRWIDYYSQINSLDPLLVAAIIQQESNWNPKARSGATGCGNGARGLMQVMPCHFQPPLNADRDGYDIDTNIKLGTKIFKSCLKQFIATDVALACYNGGPGAIKNGTVPSSPKETAEYPGKVLAHYRAFQNEAQATPVNKDDKNKVELGDVKKWLEDKAAQISEQVRIQSDDRRSSGECVKTAKAKKEKGMTIGTFSFPLSCGLFYTAPKKYTSTDNTTWDYVEMVEKKSQEYMGANGPVSYGDLIMAGGTIPMPTTVNVTIPNNGSRFGCRNHPIEHRIKFHYGVDMPISTNSPVVAVADGKVVASTNDGLIGHAVKIDHGPTVFNVNGQSKTVNFQSRYLHMITVNVKVGQQVTKGQIIAKSGGAQGIVYSDGAHLHFEVYINGAVANPYPLLTGQSDNPDLSCAHRTTG